MITSQILIQIKAIFLESLAKLVGTPQAKPENALPQPTKLVFREIEVKTPYRAGTGPAYEHPAKEKLDFNNPIDTVYHFNTGR